MYWCWDDTELLQHAQILPHCAVFHNLTVAGAMEMHLPHGEALASGGKRPQLQKHEWAEMRARQRAKAEHLVSLCDLHIDCEMQVWKRAAAGVKDLVHTIE